MTRVRSSPVTVRVDCPPSPPGVIWWFVITPSISTSDAPLTVTAMTTRTSGMDAPALNMKTVCRGERALTEKVNWKALGPSVLFVTCTPVNAFSTSSETGTGTAGPIIRVRCTPLAIGASRYSVGQGYSQPPAHPLGELSRLHGRVRVAQSPEKLRIAKIMSRDIVEAVALSDRVLLKEGEALGRRDEAAAEVDDRAAVRGLHLRGLDCVIPAV